MTVRLATSHDLEDLRTQLAGAPRLAVDTEFHAERRYLPKLYLVQVHIEGGDTWLIDPLVDGLLARLAGPLLQSTWLVHSGEQDMRLMHRALGGLPEIVLDTQIAAGLVGTTFPDPLGTLVARHLDVRVDKAATLSDWSRRPLDPAQLRYAADDAVMLPDLWDALYAQITARGRTDALHAACADAQRAAIDRGVPQHAWRDIHASRALDARSVAALRLLAAWRERTARAHDQPPHSILSPGLMVELARKRPRTLAAMAENRRMPKQVIKRYGQHVLANLEAAESTEAPPHIRHGSRAAALDAVLQAFAQVAAQVSDWSPRLVLPARLLEDIALTPPQRRAEVKRALGDWRDELVGDDLWALLNGDGVLGALAGQPTFGPRAPLPLQ